MKDPHDKETAELIPAPPKRGRPATGAAKSRAEIQREYRQRKAERRALEGVRICELTAEERVLLAAALFEMFMRDGCWTREHARSAFAKLFPDSAQGRAPVI